MTNQFLFARWSFFLFLACTLPMYSQALSMGDVIPDMELVSCEGISCSLHQDEGLSLIWIQNTESWQTTNRADEYLHLYNRFRDLGLNVVGICTDTFEDDVFDFSQVWQLPWPQVMDKECQVMKTLGIHEADSNIVIDSAGGVLAMNIPIHQIHQTIEEILAGQLGRIPMPKDSVPISTTKRDWGPEQAAGKPDTPETGDFASAWASLTPDGGDEWLKLRYETPLQPQQVKIYETLNPGAAYKLSVFSPRREEIVVWEGTDPTSPAQERGISEIPCSIDFETSQVKFYFKSKEISGWNQIDAVGIVDRQGITHWAVDAEASSTYATEIQANVGLKSYFFPTSRQVASLSELSGSDRAISELKCSANQSDKKDDKESTRLHVKAYVEGTSVLTIHKNTARWYRLTEQLLTVNSESDKQHPTSINGIEWVPNWDGQENSQWSSICTTVKPALPEQNMKVELKTPQASLIHCLCDQQKGQAATSPLNIGQAPRGCVYILESPCKENDYVLALVFEPFKQDGADWFECLVDMRVVEDNAELALANN